ncbi:MAG: hypothetical protein ABEN55_19380, partial [Bradymonadaceae bacterium]
ETLNTWRVDSPKNFCFMLHVRPEISHWLGSAEGDVPEAPEDFPPAVRQAWDVTLERADALAARALMIPTGPNFTPGESHRQFLRAFVDILGEQTDAALIWEPSGLWTRDQRVEFADKLGIAPVYDPFIAEREEHEFTHGDVAFTITERAGRRRQYDTFDFKSLIGWTQNYDRVFALLRGRHKWKHAQKMKAALQHTG